MCYDDINIVQKCSWDVVANVEVNAINIGKDVAIIDGVVVNVVVDIEADDAVDVVVDFVVDIVDVAEMLLRLLKCWSFEKVWQSDWLSEWKSDY